MRLLGTFKAADVEADAPSFDYGTFKLRTAVRAVLFDGGSVALIHVSGPGYYMLPGGGIDGDDLEAGLQRELIEELGCQAEITGEVGSAVIYNDRWRTCQTDYCYTARKLGGSAVAAPTDFERSEGHRTVWAADLDEAIRLVESAAPQERDGKLVRARDLLFLRTAKAILAPGAAKAQQ